MNKRSFAGTLLLLVAVSLSAGAAFAQETGQSTAGTKQVLRDTEEGIRLGSFLVLPDIVFSGMYDSNIYATQDKEVDDTLTVLYPGLKVNSDWDRHSLNFSAGGAFAQYTSNSNEDYDDYWTNLDGRYDFSQQTNLFGGAGFSSRHEDRSSPDDQFAGEKPTPYDSTSAHLGFSHQIGQTEMRLGGTFDRLDFQNVTNLHNDDRDRDMLGAGGRLTFSVGRRYDIFLQGVWDKRDYDSAVDDYGFRRDSEGYRAGAGVKAQFSSRLKGEVAVGGLSQDYEDPRFDTVNKPDFGGRLDWLASPATKVSARLTRSLEETTLPGASGYLYTALSVDLSRRLTSRLTLTADVSAGRDDYQGISREDRVYGGRFALRYFLDPRLYLAAGYRVTSRDSNLTEVVDNPASQQDIADYGRNQVFLSLGTLLYPAHSGFSEGADRLALPRVAVTWPGFYAGAHVGDDAFNVQVDRQSGGNDRGEFGDRDTGGGLFAGYGIALGNAYLGLELEGGKDRADIEYSKYDPAGRMLDAEQQYSYGMTARLGYTLPGGVLMYGRAGIMRSELKLAYRANNLPGDAVDDSTDLTGVRYGLGTDVPVGERLFVRLDYSYTDFDSYKADLGAVVEQLDFEQSLFRLGLGWRFGGAAQQVSRTTPVKRNGFYAGTQVGHGSLNSDVGGVVFDESGAVSRGPYAFEGEFGAQTGVTGGVFTGYGLNLGRWYAGLEAELEMSTAALKYRRASDGRAVSVQKKDTSGLSFRSGYVLANGTLLYARAGVVNTRFNTDWNRGADPALYINRDDTKSGTRLGLGAEIPLNKRLFARLDYTFTNYENYDFATSHASPDDVEFANSETLFRLGLGAQF